MSHFNHAASSWDSEGKIKLMQQLCQKTQKVLQLENKELDILDFGCGTGLFSLGFSDHAKSILGVDTSSGMIEAFNEKAKHLEHINALVINLEDQEIDQTFDLILSSMVFHHLSKPANMLKKLSLLLKDKGRIAIVDLEKEDGSFHPDPENMGVKHFGFSREEILAWTKDTDLNVNISTINEMEKNDKQYKQFLAVFSHK